MAPVRFDASRTWLTRDEAATAWGVTADSFSAEVTKGRAPEPGAHIGRTPMWDEEVLLGWIARRPGRGNWGARAE